MNNKRVYVIVLKFDGVPCYFMKQEVGMLDPKTHGVLKQPQGFFSADLKDARKFLDKWQAEIVASGYDGADVECIKTGERLK